jgi:hypothetical protein
METKTDSNNFDFSISFANDKSNHFSQQKRQTKEKLGGFMSNIVKETNPSTLGRNLLTVPQFSHRN